MNNNKKGIMYIVIAAIAFGIMPILAKLAYKGGATSIMVLFLRFTFATAMLFYYIKVKKLCIKLEKKQYIYVALLSVFGYSATAGCVFLSYNYISAGLSSMILYTYPAIVTLWAFIFYKERLYRRKIISLILSLVGVYLLVGGGGGDVNLDWRGVILALMGAFLYSAYVIGASYKHIKNINSYVLTFYISAISSVIMLTVGLCYKLISFKLEYVDITTNFKFPLISLFPHVSFYSLICILLLAFISTVVALMAFLQGVKIIGPSKASILSTLEPIVSLILGAIILKEAIFINVLWGSLLIVSSVIVLSKE